MIERMDRMHDDMFKNFGKGFGMMDPFKDDPFFNRGGGDIFARAENMMKDMMSHHDFGTEIGSGLGKGQFMK